MKHDLDIIINRMKNEITIGKYKNSNVIVAFVGGPGSGKTTISNILSKELNLYINSNDYIRRLLDEYNLTLTEFEENQKQVKEIARIIQSYLCENNLSFIIDANVMTGLNLLKENIAKSGYQLFLIKTVCKDETALSRLEKRNHTKDLFNYSGAGQEEYFRYLNNLQNVVIPNDLEIEIINTEIDITEQMTEVIKKIKLLLE